VAIDLNIPFPPGTCQVKVLTAASSGEVSLVKILPAVFIVTAALVVVAVLVVRHQRRQAVTLSERLLNTEQEMQVTQKELAVLRKAWEISWEELECGACVGEGAMGHVYRGSWRGMPVAVKVLTGVYAPLEGLKEEMDREATMLQTLRHAHVVQFLGAGTNKDGSPFIVTELMDLGALTGLLGPGYSSKQKQTHRHRHASPSSASYVLQPDDWATKIRFACEIASGMALVHSLGRMHRDLKSGNVLAAMHNGAVRLKVADFGTATLAGCAGSSPSAVVWFSRDESVLTKGIGTPLWMAPEIMAGRAYGSSADVYSFAVLLWEIAAQSEPWPDAEGTVFMQHSLLTRIEAGERLPLDPSWPPKYVALIQQCWDLDPALRPAFSSVSQFLH
jgi:LRR receptor-like serine/threonine-protein kinase FLS2